MLRKTAPYINGVWREDITSVFEVRNPYNDELLAKVGDCGAKQVEEAVEAASAAFKNGWRQTTAAERAAYLRKMDELIMANLSELAELLTLENGKVLQESKGEVTFGAGFFKWFAEECRRPNGTNIPSQRGKLMETIEEPIGVAALICPWNFPFGMPARKLAAALAAGCTCVVKPAEDTPLTTLALVALAEKAGIPAGVINVVTCSRDKVAEVGQALCDSPKVGVMSFTGSCSVGEYLYSQCARSVKRVCLELGGNAPFIVFSSADLKAALAGLMASKFRNSGQTCVTANRIMVQSDIYDKFMEMFSEGVKNLKCGNGLESDVSQGPIINKKQLERVKRIVDETIAQGGKLEMGGNLAGNGFQPTIITGVTKEMSCWKEEIFGPVAGILKFDTEEEALQLANDCDRGLAAFFYSKDHDQLIRVKHQLESGMVGANEVAISSPEAPFGGIKKSGIGKEGGRHGMEDYTQVKLMVTGGIVGF